MRVSTAEKEMLLIAYRKVIHKNQLNVGVCNYNYIPKQILLHCLIQVYMDRTKEMCMLVQKACENGQFVIVSLFLCAPQPTEALNEMVRVLPLRMLHASLYFAQLK